MRASLPQEQPLYYLKCLFSEAETRRDRGLINNATGTIVRKIWLSGFQDEDRTKNIDSINLDKVLRSDIL